MITKMEKKGKEKKKRKIVKKCFLNFISSIFQTYFYSPGASDKYPSNVSIAAFILIYILSFINIPFIYKLNILSFINLSLIKRVLIPHPFLIKQITVFCFVFLFSFFVSKYLHYFQPDTPRHFNSLTIMIVMPKKYTFSFKITIK